MILDLTLIKVKYGEINWSTILKLICKNVKRSIFIFNFINDVCLHGACNPGTDVGFLVIIQLCQSKI